MSLRVQTPQLSLLIRADASTKIGTGHVMRCLALAQAGQSEGGSVTFLMANSSPMLETRLQSEGFEVVHHPHPTGDQEDSNFTITLAKRLDADTVVVDGYHFGASYQQRLKSAGLRVLFLDDNGHADHYAADWVLNQNIHAHEGLYPSREPYTKLLLGTRYALLRKEFWPWHGWQREIPPIARKILVTLGGSDPDNATLKVMQALKQISIDDLEVVVVVGGSNPHYQSLQAEAQTGSVKFELRRNVDNMPELMAWADMAIAGGGSTCWELAFMGVPSLILTLADNQQAIVQALKKIGGAVDLGEPIRISRLQITQEIQQFITSKDLRAKLSMTGKQLIDGYGCQRISMTLQIKKFSLRPAQVMDCDLLWHWANDPSVRSASFSQEPIPFTEHQNWFSKKLQDPCCRIYIAINEKDIPIGQIRFDLLNEEEAEIGIIIDPDFRAKGLGSLLIIEGTKTFFQETSTKKVYASIKVDNISSIKSFQKAGFRQESKGTKNHSPFLRYSKSS